MRFHHLVEKVEQPQQQLDEGLVWFGPEGLPRRVKKGDILRIRWKMKGRDAIGIIRVAAKPRIIGDVVKLKFSQFKFRSEKDLIRFVKREAEKVVVPTDEVRKTAKRSNELFKEVDAVFVHVEKNLSRVTDAGNVLFFRKDSQVLFSLDSLKSIIAGVLGLVSLGYVLWDVYRAIKGAAGVFSSRSAATKQMSLF